MLLTGAPVALAVPLIPLARCETGSAARELVDRTIASGWLGYGPNCRALEERFDARGGWSLALQSCTAALWTAAMVLRETDTAAGAPEVIMPATTYAACSAAFGAAGWVVRFADVDRQSGLVDLGSVATLLNERTKALVIVDLYGQRAPEREARLLCDAHGLALVHDKAHRIDLWDSAKPLADIACYSFGPIKEAPSPEGGLLWSSRLDLEETARAVTMVGLSADTWSRARGRAEHLGVSVRLRAGLKLRQNDVAAAFVLGALDSVPEERAHRRRIYDRLRAVAPGNIRLPQRADDDSLLMCVAHVPVDQRSGLRLFLAARGLSTSDHYPSLATAFGEADACPGAEELGATVVTLPLYAGLSGIEVSRIEHALASYASSAAIAA
jgi:dTDP-4-amino-4,6-dideoxygalactose transaminase